jgi:phage baseplate assembly protein V
MDANELTRLLLNLIRKGSVIEVDHDAKKCRVSTGGLDSNWLPWFALRAGATRTWDPPTVGEQVMLFCPGGDPADGVAMFGIYSDDAPAPSDSPSKHARHYPDGAVIEYDHETHALAATLPAGGSVALTAPASVTVTTKTATVFADAATIDSPNTTCTGELLVMGKITGQGGLAISGGGAGGAAATIEGGLNATGDIKAGDISLQNHGHIEQGDGAMTSKAQPT